MIILFSIISLIWFVIIVLPFFRKNLPPLDSGQNISDEKILVLLKAKILSQYLGDEKSFSENFITRGEWQKRQDYLAAKFVDCVRRLEFLQNKV